MRGVTLHYGSKILVLRFCCNTPQLTKNQVKKLKLRMLTGKKAPLNKTPNLTKSMNMGIWAVCTLNQLFVRGF